MQLGEGLVQQQGAAGVGALREARHGRVQGRPRVWVLPHRVLRQQPHVLRPAPPRRCTHICEVSSLQTRAQLQGVTCGRHECCTLQQDRETRLWSCALSGACTATAEAAVPQHL